MKLVDTNPDHEAVYQDLITLLRKYVDRVSSSECLAIAANLLGKIIAMQDHRTMTAEHAMEIVEFNIKEGNKQAMEQVAAAGGKPN